MRNSKWLEEEIKFLKDNYKTMTYQEIADKLDRTKAAIDLKINKLGLKKSKYNYNHSFFNKIDTQVKAYWLGFIYADGCVNHDTRTDSFELSIKLQGKDYTHLKKFNKDLKGNIPVTLFTKILNYKNEDREYKQCQIRLYSKEMVLDLFNCGVVKNKSKIIRFPKLKENLIPHFIRGYFDGDGCVCLNKKRKLPDVNFTSGSLDFLLWLRAELYKNNINSYYYQEKSNTYRLYVRGMKNCDNFFNYIYKDATIYLDRKLNKKNNIYNEFNVAQRLLR